MANSPIYLLCTIFALLRLSAQAALVEYTFNVGSLTVARLCREKTITAVNGDFPGPTINVREGDTVVVHVVNESPYNVTIHWHGIFQRGTQWADGPNAITQCPIQPNNQYTYKFNIIGQEGTLWWHAHYSTLRATVYGALIIRPSEGSAGYPFPKPNSEVEIILGEWWSADVVQLDNIAVATGGSFNSSDALTINGLPGDLYPCSEKQTYQLEVEHGKTYLIRIINAALNTQLFYRIAGHRFTVVAVDASYTASFPTDVVVIAPGQTVDAIMHADAIPGRYRMAARAYASAPTSPFDNTTTVGTVVYKNAPPSPLPPLMPSLPAFNDTQTAFRFYSNLTALGTQAVPLDVDERMFVTFGLGLTPCGTNQPLCVNSSIAGSMNNASFQYPAGISMLEAHFRSTDGVYTRDFPNQPPLLFDFTNLSVNSDPFLGQTAKATKVKTLKYNSTVEMVLQDTAILVPENHPLHLHGQNFHVLAQGFGNFNEAEAVKKYNLVNPHQRNTIAVAVGGWAVIRFTANNPGMWILHCHLDAHLPLGLAMVFEVQDGPTSSSQLPPPPADFPPC